MPQHTKRDFTSIIEMDPRIEMNPSQWVGKGVMRSCRRISVAMIPVAPSIMAILLIRPLSGIVQLFLVALIAYLNAELLEWLACLFFRGASSEGGAKKVRVSLLF